MQSNRSEPSRAPTPAASLTPRDVGKDVVLLGWVHRVRDLGVARVHRHPRSPRHHAGRRARRRRRSSPARKRLRPEFVVAVRGRVEQRAPETVNPKIETGEIEVAAREIRLLNDAKTPPFPIADDIAGLRRDAAAATATSTCAASACSAT